MRKENRPSVLITVFPGQSSSMSEMSVEPRVESDDDSLIAFGSDKSNGSRKDDDLDFSIHC